MPADPPRLTLPYGLLLCDAAGTVLFALGAARQFAAIDVIPAHYLWNGYAVPFMIAGVAMMLPLLLHILRHRQALGRSRPDDSRRHR